MTGWILAGVDVLNLVREGFDWDSLDPVSFFFIGQQCLARIEIRMLWRKPSSLIIAPAQGLGSDRRLGTRVGLVHSNGFHNPQILIFGVFASSPGGT